MILVSKKIDTAIWTALDIGSPDVTVINLKTDASNITIYNFYCDQQHSKVITSTDNFAQERARNNRTLARNTHHIWLGDFNRHHPNWDNPRNVHFFTRHNLDMAQTLINTTTQHDLALPETTPTLRAMSTQNYTRPDNVLMLPFLHQLLTLCDMRAEDQPTKTDHFPIDIMINLELRKRKGTSEMSTGRHLQKT